MSEGGKCRTGKCRTKFGVKSQGGKWRTGPAFSSPAFSDYCSFLVLLFFRSRIFSPPSDVSSTAMLTSTDMSIEWVCNECCVNSSSHEECHQLWRHWLLKLKSSDDVNNLSSHVLCVNMFSLLVDVNLYRSSHIVYTSHAVHHSVTCSGNQGRPSPNSHDATSLSPFPPPFLTSLPLPLPLEVGPLQSSYRVCGRAVSSTNGVRGAAPAEIEFGAF